jgi:hypothetical protein
MPLEMFYTRDNRWAFDKGVSDQRMETYAISDKLLTEQEWVEKYVKD